VDPHLDIEPDLDAAAEKSMRITHIFETHVQADHLSGAHRLSEATDSMSILGTDKTRASEPWFVLTGDTLFSGGAGRPALIGARPAASSRNSSTKACTARS